MPTVTTIAPSISTLECHTDRAALVNALTAVGVAVSRRPAMPMMGGVLLDGRDGCLTVTATDGETVVSVRVPNTAQTPGQLLIDHGEATKMLAALVKGIRKREADTTPVAIRATTDGTAVLELGGYTMPLTTYPAEEFPTVPDVPPTIAELNREQLTNDARRVLVATGTDDTLPALTGVFLQATYGTLTLTATDRFRLAVAEVPATETVDETRSTLFPAQVLSAALKHCTADRVRIGLGPAEEWVSLSCGPLTVLTRPVQAPFPSYERLFPDTAVTTRIDRDALAQATTRATAALEAKKHTARDRSHGSDSGTQVAVTVDPGGRVSVAPVLGEHAEKATAPEYPAEVDGLSETVRVLFSATYLRDALSTLDGDSVSLRLASEVRPVVFTATDTPEYRHLLMPARPQQS